MNVVVLQYMLIAVLVVVGIVAVVRFELFCFRDLAQAGDDELRYLSRTGWIVVIALSIRIGGILYLYYGRMR